MTKLIHHAIVALTLAASPVQVFAESYQDGLSAYRRGDYATALQEWKPLAEQGNVEAQSYIGLIYAEAKGVPYNKIEAARWYHAAAEQGSAWAQYRLGKLYAGAGVLQDHVKAVRWYQAAAEQGDASAQNSLGFMYHGGYGVLQNHVEAVRWYRAAAEQGKASAQNTLGLRYQRGQGVPENHVIAHMWFNIAATNGNDDGGYNRERLAQGMDYDDIQKAQSRAVECLDSNYRDCDYRSSWWPF